MRDTIFFLGPDDINKSILMKNNAGEVTIRLSGILPLLQFVDSREKIKNNSSKFFLNYHSKLSHKGPLAETNLFNLIGDADASKSSLYILDKIIEKHNFKRVFNAPRFIHNTSRIKLPEVLADIPKIMTSKTCSIVVQSIGELKEKLSEKNLNYPFIIRKNGHHNSQFIELIRNQEQLNLLNTWFENEQQCNFICIDYVDNPNSLGWYWRCFLKV